MSAIAMITWMKSHYKLLLNAILGLVVASSISFGIISHNRANRLSEELKIANNNIEAYQDELDDSQQASGVLMLDMKKLKDYNDKLVHQLDSVSKKHNIKSSEILTAATQKQIIDVNKSKGVRGDIITILKDSTYKDSLQYNNLTKVYYTIGKDSVNKTLRILSSFMYINTNNIKTKRTSFRDCLHLIGKKRLDISTKQ